MDSTIVVKVSGHEIDDPAFLAAFAAAVSSLDRRVLIVHGGGREISDMQQRMGIEPHYIDGLRVTDAASLSLVEMVLCGTINTRLVRTLVAAGVDALGLSGVDRGAVRATPLIHDGQSMGLTGTVTEVRGDVFQGLVAQGVVPVLAPVCLGDGTSLNVNADHVAGAVAAAIHAQSVVFLTNVPGVMRDGQVVSELTSEDVQQMIADGSIFGGMIPKVRTALEAVENGAQRAIITDLEGLRMGKGTVFTR